MNIAELLEKALEECNWDLVSDVYEMMTGKKIDPPTVDDGFDVLCNITDRLASLESSIVNALGLVSNNEKKKPSRKSTPKVRKKEPKESIDPNNFSAGQNKPSRKVSAEGKANKFEDMQDAIAEAGRESGYDKINDNVKPTSRRRKSYSTKDVNCVECNKTFSVHPMFVRDNYTCDKCISRRG